MELDNDYDAAAESIKQTPCLTRQERSVVVCARALELSRGAPPRLERFCVEGARAIDDEATIAVAELHAGALADYVVTRSVPSCSVELATGVLYQEVRVRVGQLRLKRDY